MNYGTIFSDVGSLTSERLIQPFWQYIHDNAPAVG